MFAIESWPAPGTARGPRVRASGLNGAIADLTRLDLDMVVWARRVPAHWSEAMRDARLPDDIVVGTGTIAQMKERIDATHDSLSGQPHYPGFLLEDVKHTMALLAALAGANRVTMRLSRCATEHRLHLRAGMTVFCLYGEGAAYWNSGVPSGVASLTAFAPFGLAFMPGQASDPVAIALTARAQAWYLLIETL